MSVFCTECGTELPDDANFCLKCGKAQKNSSGSVQPSKQRNDEVELYRTEIKGGRLCIITTRQLIVHGKNKELERIPLNIITKVQPGTDIAILNWNSQVYVDYASNQLFVLDCKNKKQVFEIVDKLQKAILR